MANAVAEKPLFVVREAGTSMAEDTAYIFGATTADVTLTAATGWLAGLIPAGLTRSVGLR